LACIADQLRHLVGGKSRRRDVVGRRGRHRNVAVDAGVKADHRDLGRLRLLEQRDGRLGIERREADRLRLLGQRGLQHLELLVDLRLVLRPLEGDADVELLGRLLGAELHGLPELVLEALGDDRDVGLGPGRTAGDQHDEHRGDGEYGRCLHRESPW
jgi:hypothetical protein